VPATFLDEFLLGNSNLYLPKQQPLCEVKLNVGHPFTSNLVAAWALFNNTCDLVGVNHASGTNANVERAFGEWGAGYRCVADSSSSRLDLGSIDSNNPLACSQDDEFSVFAWGYVPKDFEAGSNAPRIIDISDGSNGANGWCFFPSVANNSSTSLSLGVGINGTSYRSNGKFSYDDLSKWHAMGVTAKSGAIRFFWDEEFLYERSDTYTIPGTTTNGALLNWNHTTDRQYRDGPMAIIYVWNKRIPNLWMHTLARDPYLLTVPK